VGKARASSLAKIHLSAFAALPEEDRQELIDQRWGFHDRTRGSRKVSIAFNDEELKLYGKLASTHGVSLNTMVKLVFAANLLMQDN
jgi:hypothetical protein